jgi:hypothetical protein
MQGGAPGPHRFKVRIRHDSPLAPGIQQAMLTGATVMFCGHPVRIRGIDSEIGGLVVECWQVEHWPPDHPNCKSVVLPMNDAEWGTTPQTKPVFVEFKTSGFAKIVDGMKGNEQAMAKQGKALIASGQSVVSIPAGMAPLKKLHILVAKPAETVPITYPKKTKRGRRGGARRQRKAETVAPLTTHRRLIKLDD